MNVVLTGGTRGLGYHLTKRLIQDGNNVIYTGRSHDSVKLSNHTIIHPNQKVIGLACDISKPENIDIIHQTVKSEFDTLDIWINNAGISDGFVTLQETESMKVHDIVNTNLTATILGTKFAIDLILSQKKHGHIINLEGQGSDGSVSMKYPCYGSTKAAISQFTKTIRAELSDENIGIHTLSPGMMITDLLLENSTLQTKNIFNILCEDPDTIASYIVPKLKLMVKHDSKGKDLQYLNIPKIILKLARFPFKQNRFFDKHGESI